MRLVVFFVFLPFPDHVNRTSQEVFNVFLWNLRKSFTLILETNDYISLVYIAHNGEFLWRIADISVIMDSFCRAHGVCLWPSRISDARRHVRLKYFLDILVDYRSYIELVWEWILNYNRSKSLSIGGYFFCKCRKRVTSLKYFSFFVAHSWCYYNVTMEVCWCHPTSDL